MIPCNVCSDALDPDDPAYSTGCCSACWQRSYQDKPVEDLGSDDFDDYEDPDDELDPLEEAEYDCGQFVDGGRVCCSMAGTEHCDWSCPFNNELSMRVDETESVE